jgi:type II secretory pathway pseudopilin PulG
MKALSLTPRFSGVHQPPKAKNRFSGFWCPVETARSVRALRQQRMTPMKPRANERGEPKIQTAHQTHARHRKTTLAWTLIEMMGTLAVITILAGLLLPVLVRHADKVVADQEVATLKSFRDAFQQYVVTTRVIPDQTTWYSAIAGKLGFAPNDVLYNFRQQSHTNTNSRVFLVDPALQMGNPAAPITGLPYSQTNYYVANATVSTPMLPVNPRVMIVSSLGQALPNAVVSGTFGDTTTHPYFADLWNTADGTVPSDAAWSGWTGNPGDVVVQRINLGPLFVHLVLSRYNSTSGGWYAIDGNDGTTTPLQVTSGVDGYFIQGSVLTLYTNSPSALTQPQALDTKQILIADGSFVYEQGIWRGSLTGASLANGSAGAGDVVQHFLDAATNVNSANPMGNAQQMLVASNMLAFMSNYNVWAQGGFKTTDPYKTLLTGIEPSLMTSMRGLYSGVNYPTNPYPCQ